MVATELDREEQLYWLALGLMPGLGTRRCMLLIEHFQSPRAVFRASVDELEGLGVSKSTAQSIQSGCTFDDAATQQQKMLKLDVKLLTLNDNIYPKRLRTIFDAPSILFACGRIELIDTVMIGVVGTRRPSPYGMAAADKLSRELAQAGLTIASGMARGIDTAAHKAALEVGGNTVAVFGSGIDQIYPAENRKLSEQIASRGLLVSEFPMGMPAFPQNFPVRNRIVSGLSAGILVVEGAQYSGSGITARLAIEQGRELFAVPGNITSKLSWAPNLLIKQGAKLVQGVEDVLAELSPHDKRLLTIGTGPAQPSLVPQFDTVAAAAVLSLLKVDEPKQIDRVLEDLPQYSSSELLAALLELEMVGLVRQLAGKNFIKVW